MIIRWLPMLFGVLLVLSTLAYLRYDLRRSSLQFLGDFEKQNYLELSRSDIMGLTTRLNSLLASLPWICIEAGRDGHVFFDRARGECSRGILREVVELTSGSSNELRLRFTLTIPKELRSAALIFLIGQLVMLSLVMLALRRAERIRNEGISNLARLAAQVAHDIRSPLAALEVVLQMTDRLPEDGRQIIRSSVGRIRDIANNLLAGNRKHRSGSLSTVAAQNEFPTAPIKLEPQLLSALIEPLLTEKRLQYRSLLDVFIDFAATTKSYGLFAEVDPIEFKRVLSNLVSNAVEALDGKGKVMLHLQAEKAFVQLSIIDDGKGIPPEILSQLGERGASFGKQDGSGLGLYHARTSAEQWRGQLGITSKPGEGTAVTITVPQADAPQWFAAELQIPANGDVLILDDDKSIHEIWRHRIGAKTKEAGLSDCKLYHFSTAEGLTAWYRANWNSERDSLYLIDYELLGQNATGLQLIDQLDIGARSFLVTARFEEAAIRQRCKSKGLRIIPKSMAGLISIVSSRNTASS